MNDSDQSRTLFDRGRAARDAGKTEEAVRLLRDSVEASPHFKALELLGEVLLTAGRAKDAIVPLAAASALNRQVRATSLLAEAFLALGDELAAHEIAQEALRRDPDNKKALRISEKTRAAYEAWQRLGSGE